MGHFSKTLAMAGGWAVHSPTKALVCCLQYVEVIKHFGLYSKREFLK